jgi:hypothetical protein
MRIKRMGVTWDLMKILFAQDNVIPATKVTAGLPQDAVIHSAQAYGGMIWLEVQSDSFPEVEQGQEIPTFELEFLTLAPNSTEPFVVPP